MVTFVALVPAGRKVHFLSQRNFGCAQDIVGAMGAYGEGRQGAEVTMRALVA